MMPSAAFAVSNALSGNVVPCAAERLQPDFDFIEANSICHLRAAARSTSSVAAMISGEMPSPFITQRRMGEVLFWICHRT